MWLDLAGGEMAGLTKKLTVAVPTAMAEAVADAAREQSDTVGDIGRIASAYFLKGAQSSKASIRIRAGG